MKNNSFIKNKIDKMVLMLIILIFGISYFKQKIWSDISLEFKP